jgi:hypothetical protein
MLTRNNAHKTLINADLLLQKAVVNLCAANKINFAAAQLINEGKDASFVDHLLRLRLLPPNIADELRSILNAFHS